MSSVLAYLLGVAWGALVAAPLALRARRCSLEARVDALAGRERSRTRAARFAWLGTRLSRTAAGRVVVDLVRRRRARRDDAILVRALPVTVDLLAVAVGAGCTPYVAVEVAARWAPAEVASRLRSVPRACALGSGFVEALEALADERPRLRPLTDALGASDRLGAPIGPALATLAAEERAALRRRAETHARTVPVRLLFPLVFLVLPAFGLLTVVPAVLSGLSRT